MKNAAMTFMTWPLFFVRGGPSQLRIEKYIYTGDKHVVDDTCKGNNLSCEISITPYS